MARQKKYFLLYLKTGGGHFAPAKAIYSYLKGHNPDACNPELIYGFKKSPDWIKYAIEDGYRILQAKAKWIFEFLYAINKIKVIAAINCRLVSFFVKNYLKEIILNEKPDKIIILHFFLLHPVFKILKQNKLSIPVLTIVTDPFTPHPIWFLHKNQNIIVFSDKLAQKVKRKLNKSTINTFPFVLDEKFSLSLSPEENIEQKNKLGFSPDKKILLIMGGGDGIPHGEKILEIVLKANLNVQIVIVCGKNVELFNQATELKKIYQNSDLTVYGFINFVYELLNISDVIITKCGASTIMEILILKKVAIVNDYIWEQEQGNIDYLKNNELGIYEPKIKNLPAAVSSLLNEENYSTFKQNISNEKLRNGLKEVCGFILNN